ncbi:unnamed protein product [Phytophthora lilii]|uniref:Unnamed protein product n=1 Tax=Phytophthora lilii TaxID=2077276 RepID=A0A9W6YKW4_9STRA|nr:unnamed protein product [Phytophthora lilii]
MKANIAGGPSIIFNRYAKHNETKIRGGKVCKIIIGYDATLLATLVKRFYTPLLKWYLSHIMEITKTYCFVKASSHKAFAPFMEAVSNARREGGVDKSKAMIAEMMKLVGNSAFGRSGMDMSKHKEVKSGDAMVSLSSNNYICYLPDESYKVKVSAKGIQQGGGRNNGALNPDGFETVVRDRITLQGTNKGFGLSKETKSIIT